MTTWRYCLCLLVFPCIISLSEGNCFDYFDVSNWSKNLNDEIYLVQTKNPKDMIECTLEREYLKDITKETHLSIMLHHCFKEREMVTDITEKCKGDTTEPVPLYHFMCLAAKVMNRTLSICKYDTVCKLYLQEEPAACLQTSTMLSTSTEILTTTPALPKSETAAGTTPSTTCACSGEKSYNKDKQAPHQEKEDADNTYMWIIIAILILIILVLLCCCYRLWRRAGPYGSPSERESMTDMKSQCPEELRGEMTAV